MSRRSKVVPIRDYLEPPSTGGGQFFTSHTSEDELYDLMESDLGMSGLHPEDLKWFLKPDEELPSHIRGAYYIVYSNPDGSTCVGEDRHPKMWRKKLILNKDATADQRKTKYLGPTTEAAGRYAGIPFIPQGYEEMYDRQEESKRVLLICEGEKKCIAAQKYLGFPAISIPGCWNWVAQSGSKEVHAWILKEVARYDYIIIIPDGDVDRMDINRAYTTFQSRLQEGHSNVRLLHPTGKIDDLIVGWMEKGGIELVVAEFDVMPDLDKQYWSADLLIQRFNLTFEMRGPKNGRYPVINPDLSNCRILIREHPAFDELWTDMDKYCVMYGDVVCVENLHDVQISDYIQHNLGLTKMQPATTKRAVASLAAEVERSPFLEWLLSLEWDGKPRLDTWFIKWCAAEDSEVVREVCAKWLPAACMRICNPGAIVDYMVTTTGPQGVGKSSIPKIIWGRENVVSATLHRDPKETARQLHSGLLASFEEMVSFKDYEIEKLKAVITNHEDSIRDHFVNSFKNRKRRGMLYASTNKIEFMGHDPTGYRRMPVVPILGTVDFKGLEEVREQLLAEAMVVYQSSDPDGLTLRLGNIDSASKDTEQYVHTPKCIEEWTAYWELFCASEDRLGRECVRGYYWWTTDELSACGGISMDGRWARKDFRVLADHVQTCTSVQLFKERNYVTSERTGQRISTAYYIHENSIP